MPYVIREQLKRLKKHGERYQTKKTLAFSLAWHNFSPFLSLSLSYRAFSPPPFRGNLPSFLELWKGVEEKEEEEEEEKGSPVNATRGTTNSLPLSCSSSSSSFYSFSYFSSFSSSFFPLLLTPLFALSPLSPTPLSTPLPPPSLYIPLSTPPPPPLSSPPPPP